LLNKNLEMLKKFRMFVINRIKQNEKAKEK